MFLLVPISVICQCTLRCGFVVLYRKVENVIEQSIKSHEEQNQVGPNNSYSNIDTTNNNDTTMNLRERRRTTATAATNATNATTIADHEEPDSTNNNHSTVSESSLLRLELNDLSCSIAAGTGYSLMHSILLYGTLLSSESSRDGGTLYQPSCSIMPSLINSSIMAFWFGILDVLWMMIAFYAIRYQKDDYGSNHGLSATLSSSNWSFRKGNVSSKSALLFMVLSHFIASITTTMNVIIPINGCIVALPLLSIVSMSIGIIVYVYFLKDGRFLPKHQMMYRRRQVSRHMD